MYEQFKTKALAEKVIGDGQCVSLIVNNPNSYTAMLYPGVPWTEIMAPVQDALELAGKGNSFLTWVENDHSNPSQVPPQGAIVVFGATPEEGFSNTYNNPAGHAAIVDSATANAIGILQENAPWPGNPVNVGVYPWRLSPVIGWYIPQGVGTPQPVPVPAPAPAAGETIFLPPTTGPWHLYNDGGPYLPAQAKGVLVPSQFGGLTYAIVANKGNGVYIINTQMFGQGALWTNGSDVVIK